MFSIIMLIRLEDVVGGHSRLGAETGFNGQKADELIIPPYDFTNIIGCN